MTSPGCSDGERRRDGASALSPRSSRHSSPDWLPHVARAFEPFVVKDIRVEGVQRTEAGTVFSYLPIKVGESVDDAKAAAAVKALFATGFFRDVRLEVDNGVLIVVVQERPTISKVDITGNKEFDSDTLKKALQRHRPRRGEDFRPFHAGSRGAGDEASVHHAR